MNKNYLYQVDICEWIENGLDAEIMVISHIEYNNRFIVSFVKVFCRGLFFVTSC